MLEPNAASEKSVILPVSPASTCFPTSLMTVGWRFHYMSHFELEILPADAGPMRHPETTRNHQKPSEPQYAVSKQDEKKHN